jgi:Predicted transcription regulator containing HTH domain
LLKCLNLFGMAKIKTEKQYKAACSRIEELLKVVSNDTPTDDKNFLELDLISDLVADYEEEHFPIEAPSLVDVIKLRMYEMGLTQTKLSELLNVSPSRISEYLSGKCEPTLKVAREISRKLNIDANIVLGV